VLARDTDAVVLSETERNELWRRSGDRCSICRRPLVRPTGSAVDDPAAGNEHRIISSGTMPASGLFVPQRFLDRVDNHILLCAADAQIVREQEGSFSPTVLARLKKFHEERAARISSDEQISAAVSLRVHAASFVGSLSTYYFLKISNETRDTAVRLDRVWFAVTPEITVVNPERSLPVLIPPGDLFETWQPTSGVPRTPGIEFRARALIDGDTVVESEPNRNLSPAGVVGGAGQPIAELTASVAALNHDGEHLIEKEWDVFISHAAEDKAVIVRPLAHALQARGLRVWYDEFELHLGDSLRRKVDQGIARSAFGVVVLSPAFFAKSWTNYELDGLVTRSVYGSQVILPLWHQVTRADVERFSPSLADKIACDTTQSPPETIADMIYQVVSAATVG
jgi:hypothetical protein